jgi:hypothetical protein
MGQFAQGIAPVFDELRRGKSLNPGPISFAPLAQFSQRIRVNS